MSEHLHDWLDEREPEDRPSLWDERDLDVPYNPEPPEDRDPGAWEMDCGERRDDDPGYNPAYLGLIPPYDVEPDDEPEQEQDEPVRIDWQGYRINVPRDEQCRRTLPGRRVFCEREKGHTGNHKSGPTQWGSKA